jgi:hypothetical protein
MDIGSEGRMSEFTPEFISETRKWMKKATMIEKTIMYKMLDEIERQQKLLHEIKEESFNSEDATGTMLWLQELLGES